MNVEKKTIASQEELTALLNRKISDANNSLNIICAGHFLLIPDKNKQKLIPAIFTSYNTEPYYDFAKRMVGIFPQFSFQVAAKAINDNKGTKTKNLISILVNDWQLIPEDKHRINLSKPNAYRKSFYDSFNALPDEYFRLLSNNGLSLDEDIYKTPTGEFYLKEVSLRDRFMRKAKSLFKQTESNYVPVGMCSLELDDCGNINMINEEDISQQLSDNSRAGCAAGVAQMMIDIFNQYRDSYDKINFINFMPWGCINPVNAASELALSFMTESTALYESVTISNYFLDGSNTNSPEDFFNKENKNSVVNYTFKNY